MPDKPTTPTRSFPAALKQAAMVRLEAGEAPAAIARDLGIGRKVLYGERALAGGRGDGILKGKACRQQAVAGKGRIAGLSGRNPMQRDHPEPRSQRDRSVQGEPVARNPRGRPQDHRGRLSGQSLSCEFETG
ncbi:hypothetical protein AB4Z01_35885 [Inquilinus sp. YAF38]|uniref:hypothetical protein n=1 Tax=Inquilinus sp. YAF38 TaxID=3233084 RepID=UPI003F91C9DA